MLRFGQQCARACTALGCAVAECLSLWAGGGSMVGHTGVQAVDEAGDKAATCPVCAVLGTEPRASRRPGKCCPREPPPLCNDTDLLPHIWSERGLPASTSPHCLHPDSCAEARARDPSTTLKASAGAKRSTAKQRPGAGPMPAAREPVPAPALQAESSQLRSPWSAPASLHPLPRGGSCRPGSPGGLGSGSWRGKDPLQGESVPLA